jgi:hypothetical protein
LRAMGTPRSRAIRTVTRHAGARWPGLDPDAEYIEARLERTLKKNRGENGQTVFSPSVFSVIRI